MLLTSCLLYKLNLFRCFQPLSANKRIIVTHATFPPPDASDCPSPGHVPQLFCCLATHHPDGEHLDSLYLSITAIFIIATFTEAPPTNTGYRWSAGGWVDASKVTALPCWRGQSTLLLVSSPVTSRPEMRLISVWLQLLDQVQISKSEVTYRT